MVPAFVRFRGNWRVGQGDGRREEMRARKRDPKTALSVASLISTPRKGLTMTNQSLPIGGEQAYSSAGLKPEPKHSCQNLTTCDAGVFKLTTMAAPIVTVTSQGWCQHPYLVDDVEDAGDVLLVLAAGVVLLSPKSTSVASAPCLLVPCR